MFLLIRFSTQLQDFQYYNLHSNIFLLILEHPARDPLQHLLHLHSNMFLLIRRSWRINGVCYEYLHSNMFLLIRWWSINFSTSDSNLHSNMFLLIPFATDPSGKTHYNLHSNMFLLIHVNAISTLVSNIFTFQYVSINTRDSWSFSIANSHLHSNMFLLIQGRK